MGLMLIEKIMKDGRRFTQLHLAGKMRNYLNYLDYEVNRLIEYFLGLLV